MKNYLFIFLIAICSMINSGDDFCIEASSVFNNSDEEWLLEKSQSKFKIGYPSSITPLNYYYFYSSLKGVINDISQEFSNLTDKNLSSYLISDIAENESLLKYGIIDLFVSGKMEAYKEFYYSSPIHEFEYTFYVNQGNNAKNTEDLMKYKIGIVNNDDKIEKYLLSFKDIISYPNYMALYAGLNNGEIDAIFVPRDLFQYQSLVHELREVKSTEYLSSAWYFISDEPNLISIIDRIMSKMQTMEKHADYFFNHQNALIGKLYNLDKSTYEWLFYRQPVIKVGIYDVPPFMYYNEDEDTLSGMLDYVLKQIHNNFGVKFEFVFGDYEELVGAYQQGVIDILPVFEMESNEKLFLEGNNYEIYQGQINAYGLFNQVMFQEAVGTNLNTVLGSVSSEGFLRSEMNVRVEDSISKLHEGLVERKIDYLLLDPVYLDYFEQYNLSYKGKIGKYIFSLMVRDNQNFMTLFDAIKVHDFEDDEVRLKYEMVLSSEMYLFEMSSLKHDLYLMHQQQFLFVGGIILCTSIILVLARMRYLDKKTEHLKYTDYATGLLNRLGYMNQMDKMMNKGEPFTFAIMDIDHFKSINDTYGHLVGDQVITYVANVLKKCCPQNSVICRLGGDEFVICIRDHSKEVAISVVESIREDLKGYSEYFEVTVSIGISFYRGEAVDLEKLYQQADHALYESKKNGRNQYQIFQN